MFNNKDGLFAVVISGEYQTAIKEASDTEREKFELIINKLISLHIDEDFYSKKYGDWDHGKDLSKINTAISKSVLAFADLIELIKREVKDARGSISAYTRHARTKIIEYAAALGSIKAQMLGMEDELLKYKVKNEEQIDKKSMLEVVNSYPRTTRVLARLIGSISVDKFAKACSDEGLSPSASSKLAQMALDFGMKITDVPKGTLPKDMIDKEVTRLRDEANEHK